jgi:hypothetical protein
MISFRKDEESNKQQKAYDKLLKILLDQEEYYNGSFHESSDLTQLVQIVYKTLFDQNNNSIQLIIDKNPNNSIDITIDTIK